MALSISIRADATHFTRTIAGVQVQMSGLTGRFAQLTSGSLSLAGSIAKAGLALGAMGGAVAAAFLASSSKAAASMESLSVQFEVLTGSASKSAELIAKFREEAQKSPLSVTDYANAGKTLMAFGTSAEDALPTLKVLGDVSMGNAERFGSLALAFAQTQAAGRLMGQEVLQFVNAGFNPLQEISRKTGRSMIDLKKAMEDGAISSQMVSDAFKSATSQGGLFFGAIEKGAGTTEGKVAKVMDAILSLKIALGTGFNEGLKSALDASDEFFPALESRFSGIGKILGNSLKSAVEGDYEMFAKIGIFIGEAIKAGVVDVAGNLLVDSIRGWMNMTGDAVGGNTAVAARAMGTALLGPKQSIGDRAMDMATQMRPLIDDISRTNDRKFGDVAGPNLPPGYHDKMFDEAMKQTGYLKLLAKDPFEFSMGPLFSR